MWDEERDGAEEEEEQSSLDHLESGLFDGMGSSDEPED